MDAHDTLNRRSRMFRRATQKRIELTDRDLEIFRLLHRYRYLRGTHIHALAGGKSQKRFIERLGDLYHEGGYVNRPSQQWQAINARYMPAVYELGEAGERVLKQRDLLEENTSPLLRKAKLGEIRQYHHELMICDIISSIEIGVRANPTLRFISWRDILAKAPEATRKSTNSFAVPVSVSCTVGDKQYMSDKPLIPDALFGIEYTTNRQKSYRFFALEADRDSEPVVRANLHQTSYLRKILQYREIAARTVYKTHWGLPNLFVLTVTTNEKHMKSMIRLVDELTNGKGSTSLLFKTMPSLASLEKSPLPTPYMLTEPWCRAGYDAFHVDNV